MFLCCIAMNAFEYSIIYVQVFTFTYDTAVWNWQSLIIWYNCILLLAWRGSLVKIWPIFLIGQFELAYFLKTFLIYFIKKLSLKSEVWSKNDLVKAGVWLALMRP